ncbi:MAG: hypothetical protein R3F43_15835 [bacterium]
MLAALIVLLAEGPFAVVFWSGPRHAPRPDAGAERMYTARRAVRRRRGGPPLALPADGLGVSPRSRPRGRGSGRRAGGRRSSRCRWGSAASAP